MTATNNLDQNRHSAVFSSPAFVKVKKEKDPPTSQRTVIKFHSRVKKPLPLATDLSLIIFNLIFQPCQNSFGKRASISQPKTVCHICQLVQNFPWFQGSSVLISAQPIPKFVGI
jgi:hypothetical protein